MTFYIVLCGSHFSLLMVFFWTVPSE